MKELAYLAVCFCVLGALTAGWWLLAPRALAQRFRPLAAGVSPPPSADWYLGYFNGEVEHGVVYNNVDGAAGAIKDAQVLFLGSSLVKYAFRDRAALEQFFGSRGLRYFVLGFGAEEGGKFPEAIIRRYDLHPKWVVVNANPFFGTRESAAAQQAVRFGYLGAWETSLESVTALAVQRRIHRIFPDFALSQWDAHPQWIEYRAKSDGTIRPVWRAKPSAVGPADEHADTDPPARAADEAREFEKDLRARGARLILTWIPPSQGTVARGLASLLKVPLIEPRRSGLSTIDGTHLDYESARRFDAAFLPALGQIFDDSEGALQARTR